MGQTLALVAEDSPINQMLVTELLEDLGVKVMLADNGLKAIELCQAHQFSVIFMDLEMPVMGGHEATQSIREQQLSFAPIIALTAHEKEGKLTQLKKSGFNGFLQKPINTLELTRIIQAFTHPTR
jgi:CheY-like chemotaxis protein